jgi:uncharacterized protein YeaO (DUF488 family)
MSKQYDTKGGLKVLAQYAKTLIWIELWTPTAAILHMFVSIQAEEKLKNMYNTNTGITLMNSVDMLSETTTLASVGAMLYVSVPAITWLMITGSGQMLGNVMSGAASSFGSQLAKDQSGIEQAKDLQRQKINQKRAHDSEGRQAALSYGEMMFYENLQKGHLEAGTFMGQKEAMDKNYDIADLRKSKEISDIYDANTRKKELMDRKVINENGNINNNKFDTTSKDIGTAKNFEVMTKTNTSNELYKDLGIEKTSQNQAKSQEATILSTDNVKKEALVNSAQVATETTVAANNSIEKDKQISAAEKEKVERTTLSNKKYENLQDAEDKNITEGQEFINNNDAKKNIQDTVGNEGIVSGLTTQQVAQLKSVNNVDSKDYINSAKFDVKEKTEANKKFVDLNGGDVNQAATNSANAISSKKDIDINSQNVKQKTFSQETLRKLGVFDEISKTNSINSNMKNTENRQKEIPEEIQQLKTSLKNELSQDETFKNMSEKEQSALMDKLIINGLHEKNLGQDENLTLSAASNDLKQTEDNKAKAYRALAIQQNPELNVSKKEVENLNKYQSLSNEKQELENKIKQEKGDFFDFSKDYEKQLSKVNSDMKNLQPEVNKTTEKLSNIKQKGKELENNKINQNIERDFEKEQKEVLNFYKDRNAISLNKNEKGEIDINFNNSLHKNDTVNLALLDKSSVSQNYVDLAGQIVTNGRDVLGSVKSGDVKLGVNYVGNANKDIGYNLMKNGDIDQSTMEAVKNASQALKMVSEIGSGSKLIKSTTKMLNTK